MITIFLMPLIADKQVLSCTSYQQAQYIIFKFEPRWHAEHGTAPLIATDKRLAQLNIFPCHAPFTKHLRFNDGCFFITTENLHRRWDKNNKRCERFWRWFTAGLPISYTLGPRWDVVLARSDFKSETSFGFLPPDSTGHVTRFFL